MKKFLTYLTIALSSLTLGCATSANPNDPYEDYNRQIFAGNMAMDKYILRPVTVGYTYVPDPLREVIGNFYSNLRDFVSLGNDVLQLDGMNTMQTFMRIAINSTFGIFGLLDISTSMGLPEYKNNFGNTFKRWGWTDSHYLLIPFLGPGTVRDQLGLIPDIYFNPLFWIINDPLISWPIFAINLLDMRSQYLDQDQLLEQTLDPYATIRDLYLQKNGLYVFPTESVNVQKPNDDENIDDLISEQNGESSHSVAKKTTASQVKVNTNSDDIDAMIAEENSKPSSSTAK